MCGVAKENVLVTTCKQATQVCSSNSQVDGSSSLFGCKASMQMIDYLYTTKDLVMNSAALVSELAFDVYSNILVNNPATLMA
jgi:hypothetical protein